MMRIASSSFILLFSLLFSWTPAASAAGPSLTSPEKLVYKAKYLGIPIGEFILVNRGLTALNGRPAYRFELTVRTLPFLGRIKDFYVAYMDARTLSVLRHEEYVRGRLESVVDFDYDRLKAFYVNAVNGRHAEVSIPGPLHDILTGGYFLRTVPLKVGEAAGFDIYADEKVYRYSGMIQLQTKLRVHRYGKQNALLLKSSLSRNGKAVKALSAEVYLSTDPYRKPYRAVLHTIVGSVAVVLVED